VQNRCSANSVLTKFCLLWHPAANSLWPG
jgi:hypothetical protein